MDIEFQIRRVFLVLQKLVCNERYIGSLVIILIKINTVSYESDFSQLKKKPFSIKGFFGSRPKLNKT